MRVRPCAYLHTTRQYSELYIICGRRKRRKGKWCEREEYKGDEKNERESERDGGREGGSEKEQEREREKGKGRSARLHRSRSTVCKPSSIIKFLLARALVHSVCIYQGGSVFIQNSRIAQKLVHHSRIKVRLSPRIVALTLLPTRLCSCTLITGPRV